MKLDINYCLLFITMINDYYTTLRELIFTCDNVDLISQFINTIPNFSLEYPIDSTGISCLHLAVQIGNISLVEYLCSEVDVNICDCLGRTPLHIAAAKENTTILKMLIASKADVNYKSISGETPLIKAIKFNRQDNVEILLRYGANSSLIVNVSIIILN